MFVHVRGEFPTSEKKKCIAKLEAILNIRKIYFSRRSSFTFSFVAKNFRLSFAVFRYQLVIWSGKVHFCYAADVICVLLHFHFTFFSFFFCEFVQSLTWCVALPFRDGAAEWEMLNSKNNQSKM